MAQDSHLRWRPKESRWRVQMARRGKCYERHFSVKEYGSPAAAKLAALRWRDAMLATLPRRRIILRSRRNRSGKVGVELVCKTNPSGEKYWSWVAHWRQDGKNRSRKFSILKYGDQQAWELAVAAREKAIA